MESFSAHFNLTSMALLGMLALSAAVLVMGVTLDLATHPVMGPVCQCQCQCNGSSVPAGLPQERCD